jgi:hypothetical protein
VELFEQIRREYEHGVGTVKGVARKFKVHRGYVRSACGLATPPASNPCGAPIQNYPIPRRNRTTAAPAVTTMCLPGWNFGCHCPSNRQFWKRSAH